MARATYIWTVTQADGSHPPVAAFTVKRELVAWWALWKPDVHARLRVWRHHDARPATQPIDVTHELET